MAAVVFIDPLEAGRGVAKKSCAGADGVSAILKPWSPEANPNSYEVELKPQCSMSVFGTFDERKVDLANVRQPSEMTTQRGDGLGETHRVTDLSAPNPSANSDNGVPNRGFGGECDC